MQVLTIEALIQRHGLKPNERGAYLPVPCPRFYTGSTYGGDVYTVRVPPLFKECDEWSDGFRTVWISPEARAIFTYCEGDLDLTVDDTEEQFQARLKSAAEFYKEH